MSSKRKKEIKTPEKKPVEETVELTLEVLEIGNMEFDEGQYVFDATFMGKPLKREKLKIFKPCRCAPTDNYNYSWILPLKISGPSDVVDISSNQIIVTCFEVKLEEEEDEPEVIGTELLTTHSLGIIDLFDVVTTEQVKIVRKVVFQYLELKKGGEKMTWPNKPFMKYRLATSKAILPGPEINSFNTISITLECVVNMPEKMLTHKYIYEAGMVIPLESGQGKILKCTFCGIARQDKLPPYKVFWNLSHLEHYAKFSEIPTYLSYTKDDITFPKVCVKPDIPTNPHTGEQITFPDSCMKRKDAKTITIIEENTSPVNCVNLQDPLLDDETKLVAFYCYYKCVVPQKTLTSITTSSNSLSLELFVKPRPKHDNQNMAKESQPEKPAHFLAFFNPESLRYAGETHIRRFIPLQKFDMQLVMSKCGHSMSVFAPGLKPQKVATKDQKGKEKKGKEQKGKEGKEQKGEEGKGKEKKKVREKGTALTKEISTDDNLDELETKFEKIDYVENDDGNAALVAIEIQLGTPLVPKRIVDFTIEEMMAIESMKGFETGNKYSMHEAFLIFKREIEGYAANVIAQNESGKDLMTASLEGDLMGCATALLSKKFNYSDAVDEESTQNILENSYIYLINQIHKIITLNSCDPKSDFEKAYSFKLLCGIECYQLGMVEEAKDFYIMHIRDGRTAEDYVIYSMACLFDGTMQTSVECCDDALKFDPHCYMAYLLQGYVAFSYKEYKEAEKILRCGTLKIDNFIELWLALFVIHYHVNDKAQMAIDLRKALLAYENPYHCFFYDRTFILTWERRRYTDPILNGIVNFLRWGCLEFAEILLAWGVHEYGCQSFAYLYYIALIEYYRKNYPVVLQRLGSIKECTNIEQCDKLNLRAHTLLILESTQAVSQIREYLKLREDKRFNERTALLFNKLAKLYITLKKYNTASFYLKQSAYAYKTYASYVLLGQVELHIGNFDNAEICFKKTYQLNPFNTISWANLAMVYYRKGLVTQCKLAIMNARKQSFLDEKLAEDLKKIEESLENDKCSNFTGPARDYCKAKKPINRNKLF